MLTGILIIAIVGLLAVLSHRRSKLEDKIYKHVPVEDWLVVFVFPLAFYIGWFFVVKNIVSRPTISVFPLDDIDILALTILFMIYGFVGNGIHFTGKILWRYLKASKNSMVYKINEMFHGKLSHYLVYLNGIFIFFLLAILEINHPISSGVTDIYLSITIILGVIFGFAVSKAIFYTNEWFGGYNKPLVIISLFIISMIVWLDKSYQINYSSYPVYLFVTSMSVSFVAAFIIRQLLIFMKLGNKRRLRFLAKMFSV